MLPRLTLRALIIALRILHRESVVYSVTVKHIGPNALIRFNPRGKNMCKYVEDQA